MSIVLKERTGNKAEAQLTEQVQQSTAKLLNTIFDYAEQSPEGIFLMVHFGEHAIDGMLVMEQGLYPLAAYQAKRVSAPEEQAERQERLRGYFQEDYQELLNIFKHHRKQVPLTYRVAADLRNQRVRSAYSYALGSAPELESAALVMTGWAQRVQEEPWGTLPL